MLEHKALGLIAGYGNFPLELAQVLRAQGFSLHTVAVREETSPAIEALSDSTTWLQVGQLKSMIRTFEQAGVSQVVMAGKVKKLHLFRNFKPDFLAVKMLLGLPDKRDDSILCAICDLLAASGIDVISQLAHAGDMLAGDGLLFGPQLSKSFHHDLAFAFAQAKGIAGLDIGQTIVVQDGAVLAVEAIEGTDEAIKRGGMLGNGKAMVVKVAKPEQDLRFDVPAIGPDTLEVMHAAECKALIVESGMTLLLERSRLQDLATRYNISVYGTSAPMLQL